MKYFENLWPGDISRLTANTGFTVHIKHTYAHKQLPKLKPKEILTIKLKIFYIKYKYYNNYMHHKVHRVL